MHFIYYIINYEKLYYLFLKLEVKEEINQWISKKWFFYLSHKAVFFFIILLFSSLYEHINQNRYIKGWKHSYITGT